MGRGALVVSIFLLTGCSGSPDHPAPDAGGTDGRADLAPSDGPAGDGPDVAADTVAPDVPQNLDAPVDAPSTSDGADSPADVPVGDGGSSDAPDASCPMTLPPVPDGGVSLPLPGVNPASPSSTCATCVTTCAGATCDSFMAAEDRAICRNLEACVQRACAAIDGVHCYCDQATEQTCVTAGPVGICRPEIEAAAGTSDPAAILPVLKASGVSRPLGLVLTRATCARTTCFGSLSNPNGCNPYKPYGAPSCAGGNPSQPCNPNGPGCDLYCTPIPVPEEPIPPLNCAQPLAALEWTVDPGPEVQAKLFSVAPNDTWLWFYGGAGTRYQHWDGETWTEQVPPWKAVAIPAAIWATGSKDIWFSVSVDDHLTGVGDFQTGSLKRWSGTQTTTMLGFAVKSVWGLGPNDVWVVDERGRVLHWNGSTWRDRTPGAAESTVRQIRGAATDDVWGFDGVGPGLSHWDGARWALPAGTDPELRATVIQAIWAGGKNDAWLLGKRCGGSQLWHWDGARWSLSRRLTTNARAGLWGTAGNDVWLWTLSELRTFGGAELWPDNPDGTEGRVEHFDGTSWSVVSTGAYVLDTFSPEGPGVIWATGRISGKEIYPASRLFHLHPKCGDAPSDGGVVSPPYNWSSEETTSKWLWSFGPNDVWRSGDDGIVFRWNGSQWTQFLPKNTGDPPASGKMWGTSPNDVWFVNGTNLRHWDGSKVEDRTPPSSTHKPVDVFGFGPTDVWSVKRSGTLDTPAHWDGAAWTDYPLTSEPDPFAPRMVTAMWGAGPTDLWALSHYAIGVPATNTTRDGARFFHWNGGSWTEIGDYMAQTAGPWGGGWLSTGQFNAWAGPWKGAWGSSASDVWAAGVGAATDSHVIWHFDGKTWAQAKKPTDGDGGAVWGSGPNDVWSASPHGYYTQKAGRVYHSSGGAFERVDVGLHWGYLDGVSPAADEVWMIGEYYKLPRVLLHGRKNGP